MNFTCCGRTQPEFRPGDSHRTETDEPGTVPGAERPDWSLLRADRHPRLIFTDKDFEDIRLAAKEDVPFRQLHAQILQEADRLIGAPPLEHRLAGKRLLAVSRAALTRIAYCAYAYRTTGERKYFDQAVSDMQTVCRFPDWNARRHFLDVGEMTAAVAIGYDWLYAELTDETKRLARKAIVDFGFTPAEKGDWNLDFYQARNNWNQVCNAGLACGALALYEQQKTISRKLILKAVETNEAAMKAIYSPDGNYPEGYSYWNYGTGFEVLLLTVLQTALGTDFGLSKVEGFSRTGQFMLHMEGPNKLCFNYSDCAPDISACMPQWYFAFRSGDLSHLYLEKDKLAGYSACEDARLLPLYAYYAFKLDLKDLADIPAPAEKIFRGGGTTPVVLIHRNWKMDATDRFLGIKGGKAGVSHGHQDAGSFVYDAFGARWSADLGLQSYGTLEPYVRLWDMQDGSERWTVFRYNNFNHSTITVNGKPHLVDGFAPILSVIDEKDRKGAVVDLTPPLRQEVESALREVWMQGDDLYVKDRVRAKPDKTASVRWTLVTKARPVIEYGGITLKSAGGRYMQLTVSSPTGHRPTLKIWSTKSANPWDASNAGSYECGYELNVRPGTEALVTVRLRPEE